MKHSRKCSLHLAHWQNWSPKVYYEISLQEQLHRPISGMADSHIPLGSSGSQEYHMGELIWGGKATQIQFIQAKNVLERLLEHQLNRLVCLGLHWHRFVVLKIVWDSLCTKYTWNWEWWEMRLSWKNNLLNFLYKLLDLGSASLRQL